MGNFFGCCGTKAASAKPILLARAVINGNLGSFISKLNIDTFTYLGVGNYRLTFPSAGFTDDSSITIVGNNADYTFNPGYLCSEQIDKQSCNIQYFQVDPTNPAGFSAIDTIFSIIITGQ